MRNWTKAVVVAFAAVGVLYVTVALLFGFGVFQTSCHAATAMTLPSPSGTMFARVETEACDDKPLETVVWLSSDPSNRTGTISTSVFKAVSAQEVSSGSFAPVQVRLRWATDRDLDIAFPKGIEPNAREGTYHGVNITLHEFDPRAP